MKQSVNELFSKLSSDEKEFINDFYKDTIDSANELGIKDTFNLSQTAKKNLEEMDIDKIEILL